MAKHSNVKDAGAVFEIVPNTRKVVVPTSHFVIGTVGEHLSEQVTFECPATIDGHDITGCDKHYVTWQSADGTVGHDELVGMTVNEGVASFKWNVRNGLTTASGVVSFSVHFEDTALGNTVYKFSTTTCKSCEILDAINAVVGAYEAVYVAEDTLIFADYNAVAEGKLTLDGKALIPEGTLEITANGSYDVGKYAEARVDVKEAKPSITVGEDGTVTASTPADTTTYQLSEFDDPDFIAENIRGGVKVFGVSGQCPSVEYVTGKISNNSTVDKITVHLMNVGVDGSVNPRFVTTEIANESVVAVVKNSLIAIRSTGANILLEGDVEMIEEYMYELYVVKPTGDDFKIWASDKG